MITFKSMKYAAGLFALILIMTASPTLLAQDSVPEYWGCDPNHYEDGICDCGCDVPDPDCPRGFFEICERSGCIEGQVPWEHRPTSCMRSACGDGWTDESLGEVCDDGEALDGGGCSAGCDAVNLGWTCGPNAAGCTADRVESMADMEVLEAPDMTVEAPEQPDMSVSSPDMMADPIVIDAALQGETDLTFPSAQESESGGCSLSGGPTPGLAFVMLLMIAGSLTKRRERS